MRKPFAMIAMSIMVGYSILTLFLGMTILEKERIRFHPGGSGSTNNALSTNNLNHKMTQLLARPHRPKQESPSTWQRRRQDMLLPNTTTTTTASVYPSHTVPVALTLPSPIERDSSQKSPKNSTNNNPVLASNEATEIGRNVHVVAAAATRETTSMDETNHEMELSNRFPVFGTEAFAASCPWVLPRLSGVDATHHHRCSILARPDHTSGEGLSHWVGQVAVGFILAQQAGCKFYLDYGKGIDVDTILEPVSTEQLDWRIPTFDYCKLNDTCFIAGFQYNDNNQNDMHAIERLSKNTTKLAYIPALRHAYATSESYFNSMDGFRDLNRTLPGFDIETSMACSLGSLFRLSSRATMYEPTLFTELLPALHAPDTLVMALYIRTGRTEHLIQAEATHVIKELATRIADCATRIEQERVALRAQRKENSNANNDPPYARIVWMIATDSQYLKTWIKDEYTRDHATIVDGNITGGSGLLPPRSILSTKSRGAHTKPGADPSTADFAEALLDWYLLGESDVVVGDHNGPTFGDTAAFRTVRPYYKVPKGNAPHIGSTCGLLPPTLRWNHR
jgi:hypothetical protein